MIVEGWIELLECADCGASPPHWVFSADTDMTTQELRSAGSRDGQRLVLSKEALIADGPEVRAARFKRVADDAPSAKGLTFAQFRKVYRKQEPAYDCPWCPDGEMAATAKLGSKEYIDRGGKIECRDGISIRKGN